MDKAVEVLKEVWSVELFRGVLLTLGVFFAIMVLEWIIRLIIFCKFGRRRCSTVTISCPSGDIVVSANAVSSVIEAELKAFPELDVRRILLFCKRGVYSMVIRAALVKTGTGRGLPELHSLIEPLVKRRIEEIFGLKDISGVTLRIDRSGNFDDYDDVPETPELPDESRK
ncbi:MAG: hypothetical protein J6R86_05360 [Lentisphaeria bacterium]|nr:hypothetical protein [Lentisphaeria bacterium]